MKQLGLKPVGLTDRAEYNATVANFKQIESVVNSNAATGGQELEQLDKRITALEEQLDKRITALEDMLFGQKPQEVKMAENSTSLKKGGAMLVNLTSEEDK